MQHVTGYRLHVIKQHANVALGQASIKQHVRDFPLTAIKAARNWFSFEYHAMPAIHMHHV